jgi:hypothetical protein
VGWLGLLLTEREERWNFARKGKRIGKLGKERKGKKRGEMKGKKRNLIPKILGKSSQRIFKAQEAQLKYSELTKEL